MPERRVEYMPLPIIEAAERNPKRHAASDIRQSIDRFGLGELPLIDERTGRLVAGHGRLDDIAERRRTGQNPPDGVQVGDGGEWLVPVVRGWGSRSDAEAEAYLVASNKLTTKGGWDDEALAEVLSDLADADLLALTGFSEGELADLLGADGTGAEAGHTDPDEVPAAPPDATAPGDTWRLGPHRVRCGDARDVDAVAALLAGERAEAMWTDPPYGVDYVGKTSNALTIVNDDAAGLPALLAGAFAAAGTALRPGAAVYVAAAPGPLVMVTAQAIVDAGWLYRQNLIWVKDAMVLGHFDYHARHEPILYGFTPGGTGRLGRGGERWYGDNAQTTVVEVAKPSRSADHPTMKPVELIASHLANSCPRGGLVFDPFAGSGSTLIAAHRLGMRAAVMELDPRYVDVICRRFQEHTDIKPIRDATGEPVDFAAEA